MQGKKYSYQNLEIVNLLKK